MVDAAWVFLWEDDEAPGDRIARCCREVLRDGPMGRRMRPRIYRQFISCGFTPPLSRPFDGADIGAVKTSCGVFVRGVLHWAGREAKRPGVVGGALVGGWLEGLSFRHPAWRWASQDVPVRGAVFYRDYGRGKSGFTPTNSGHVGVFVEQVEGSIWVTAEGGGSDARSPESNGTVCRLTEPVGKDVRVPDVLGRNLIGWWDPEHLGLRPWRDPDVHPDPMDRDTVDVETVDTVPAPAQHTEGVDVSKWQRPIDWPTLANAGYRFSIARAAYGNRPDRAFGEHFRGARNAGLTVGAYQFVRMQEPDLQWPVLHSALQEVGLGPGDILPVLDLERDVNSEAPHPEDYLRIARELISRCVDTYGGVLLYYSPAFFAELGRPEELLEHPLWIAHYGVSAPAAPKRWSVWQHSGSGEVPGYDGKIDLNYARELPLIGAS